MAKANVVAGMGLKRPGPVEYSSDSYHCSVELVDVDIEDADHFRALTAVLFTEVKQALEAEVAGSSDHATGEKTIALWGPGGNGNGHKPASRQDAPDGTATADRNRSHTRPATTPKLISNKQAQYLFKLARQAGMKTQAEVGSWIAETLGVEKDVYALSKVEASQAIDLLNSGAAVASR